MHELDKLSILQLPALLVRQKPLFHYIWMIAFPRTTNPHNIMKRTLFTAVSAVLLTIFITGCGQTLPEIDYSALNTDEKALLSIQDEVNAQIGKLNAELQKDPLNYDQIRFLATETSSLITKSAKEAERLAGKVENEKIISETTRILSSADSLVGKVKELSATLQKLQRELANATEDAKAALEQKLAENQKLLDGYTLRLESTIARLGELRLLFTEKGEKALSTSKEPTRQQLDATI